MTDFIWLMRQQSFRITGNIDVATALFIQTIQSEMHEAINTFFRKKTPGKGFRMAITDFMELGRSEIALLKQKFGNGRTQNYNNHFWMGLGIHTERNNKYFGIHVDG